MQTPHLILLLYDSITNSVFESQVFKPYHTLLEKGYYATITLISYEKQDFLKNADQHPSMRLLQTAHPSFTYHFLERSFFWGRFSLRKNIKQLRALLAAQPAHTLIARGPISGYIARHALSSTTRHLTIQARGLLYEEYKMTNRHHQSPVKKIVHTYRAHQYKTIEQLAYKPSPQTSFTVESVTPALTMYLRKQYKLEAPTTLATHDIPHKLSQEERSKARNTYRTALTINPQAPVYAYNGSFKPWQYADATFAFFRQRLQENPGSILLCISQDLEEARKKAVEYNLPAHALRCLSVSHQEVIPLLCAADFGLLFREPHIVNTTSRPTKLLEYQSAGLTVIHNNTIDILQNEISSIYAEPPKD